MNERKNIILQLLLGTCGVIGGLFGVNAFNQYVLMGLPISLRMVMMIITYWAVAIVPFGIMIFAKDKLSEYGFVKEKIVNQVIIGIILGGYMSFVLTLIPTFVGLGDWVDNGHRYRYAWQFIYEFAYCIVAIGLAEEYVFRGFIYSKVKKLSGSVVISVVVSSILFGVFHILGGNIIQMIMTSIIGVFLCICREKIRNCTILSLIIAHGIYDALITVWNSVL